MNRHQRAHLGKQTLEIIRRGDYELAGARVAIADAVARARAGTRSYPPHEAIADPAPGDPSATRIEVANRDTLEAARALLDDGHSPCALNFASAKNPGGGFLSGAQAQEEALARASGLFACLEGDPMYDHHRRGRDALYTSWAIYSPAVPVFRDAAGGLLAEPWECAFITAPAPNAGAVLKRDRGRRAELSAALAERIHRVLAIAAAHGHDAVVLGAWGCGVFRNDPEEVAGLAADALAGPFAGVFARVVFAVLDGSPERRFIGPFERRFGRA